MKILGLDITRSAPKITATATEFQARSFRSAVAAATIPDRQASASLLQASGELPQAFPKRVSTGSGLSGRSVSSSVADDYFWQLPNKLPPRQIEMILRQAAAGSLQYQHQLNRRMEESWPVYRKAILELKLAIASCKYVVHPYALPGKKPTASAEAKADLVTRAITNGFKPDRFSDEDGVNGMIFDLCDAIPMGVSMVELIWDENAIDPAGQNESTVRASAWVNPRNIAFTPDGRMGVADAADSGYMGYSNQGQTQNLLQDEDKYLVAKFKSKSGSPLTAGLMRSLADIWTIVVYGRDFARLAMQKYGNPFISLAYDAGITDPNMISRFEQLAQMAAANGYCAYPSSSENTKLTIEPGHTMGADNAQIAMMRLADEACQLLLLGQTLTSSAPVNGGTRAQGDVHENVRQERIEEHAKWIARILTEQFADSLCRVNYGPSYLRNPERPTVEPDLTRPLSLTEKATFLKDMSQSKVPVIADKIYKQAGEQMPQAGDHVLMNGELVIFEEPMTPTEKREIMFDEQLDQQVSVNQAMGQPGEMPGDDPLSAASADDLRELENLVTAAERAEHKNGEIVLVQKKWQEIVSKSRA